MISQLLAQLRVICRLLNSIEAFTEADRPAVAARVYGPGEIVSFRIVVQIWPIYPDYENYRAGEVLRGKVTRQKLASKLESEVSELLVGYKTEVRIDRG